VRLNEIYDTYRNDIDFFLIYIREVHPSGRMADAAEPVRRRNL